MKILRWFSFVVLVALLSCSSLETIQAPQAPAPTEGNQIEKLESGTITGNPTKPSQYSTVNISMNWQPELSAVVECQNSFLYKMCQLPLESSSMGVSGLYLVDCEDTYTGDPKICSNTLGYKKGTKRKKLFEASAGDIELISLLPGQKYDRQVLVDFEGEFSGVQAHILFVDFKVATLVSQSSYADLSGANFRICFANHEEFDSSQMQTFCGTSSAEQGDLLVDLDLDGTWGYLDYDGLQYVENPARVTSYFLSRTFFSQYSFLSFEPYAEDDLNAANSKKAVFYTFGLKDYLNLTQDSSHNLDFVFDGSKSVQLRQPLRSTDERAAVLYKLPTVDLN